MMMNTTLDQLRILKLDGLAGALEEQLTQPGVAAMSFEERLALGNWVQTGQCILICGPTGAGKSWLACALAQYACRRGHSACYQRVPRLPEELAIRHASGTFGKWLIQLAKTDVLLLDDWGMGALDGITRSDLLEIIDDRTAQRATIITSCVFR